MKRIHHFLIINLILYSIFTNNLAQNERSLMNLISAKEIAEITQLATDFAAQTMQSNSDLLSKPGRPEVRPLSLNQSPSEIIGQSLTNILTPASQQFAKALSAKSIPLDSIKLNKETFNNEIFPLSLSSGSRQFKPLNQKPEFPKSEFQQTIKQLNSFFNFDRLRSNNENDLESKPINNFVQQNNVNNNNNNANNNQGINQPAINSLLQFANTFFGGNKNNDNINNNNLLRRKSTSSLNNYENNNSINGISQLLSMSGVTRNKNNNYQMPTLSQFLPMADRNFGFQRGEGCFPFVGEFMKIIYGNCVKQADQKTWDMWGKEIQNGLTGGKIDLLKASKETCKKSVERENCGQLRHSVSECDIIGSIQLVTNMQRSIDRCDEISGLIDQNPVTVLKQMNGLIGGEVAQGFLNNFLG